ncbi:MAG: hypothetical protein AMXMBFR33_55050 [Candidatus Xenobia bacterium]
MIIRPFLPHHPGATVHLRPTAAPGPVDGFAPGLEPAAPVVQPRFAPVQAEGWRLSDLASVGEVHKQAMAIVDGSSPFKGHVINGFSGSGLTSLMKAMAGELEARGTPTLFASGADLAESGVRELFAEARARNAVVFIDGLDGVAPIRTAEKSQPSMLELVDELEPGDVRVVASTSRKDVVDLEAIRHLPGLLEVPLPRNEIERRGIIDVLMRRKALSADPADLADMAQATRGKGPADLSAILDLARQSAGGPILRDVDLMEARLTHAAGPPEPLAVDERFFKLSVAHEMGHVVVRHFFQRLARESKSTDELPQAIDLVSFHPRKGAQAFVNLMFGGNAAKTFEYYFAEMASDYGGRAAEYFFGKGHLSAGPAGDLSHAQQLSSPAAQLLAQEAVQKGMGVDSGAQTTLNPTADAVKLEKAAEEAAYTLVAFYGSFIKEFSNEMFARRQNGQELTFSGRELTRRLTRWEADRAVPLAVLAQQIQGQRDRLRPQAPPVFDPVSGLLRPAAEVAKELSF